MRLAPAGVGPGGIAGAGRRGPIHASVCSCRTRRYAVAGPGILHARPMPISDRPESRPMPEFAPAADERRNRPRLRELCDEVIASYRLATDGEPFGEDARQEAHAFLAQAGVPRAGRRTRARG